MSNLFKDRQPVYPNRYKITDESGSSYYVTLERADEATVEGTALNATMLNKLLPETGGTMSGPLTIDNQLIMNGTLVRTEPLSVPMPLVFVENVHFGTSLPAAGNPGRIFFKKV